MGTEKKTEQTALDYLRSIVDEHVPIWQKTPGQTHNSRFLIHLSERFLTKCRDDARKEDHSFLRDIMSGFLRDCPVFISYPVFVVRGAPDVIIIDMSSSPSLLFTGSFSAGTTDEH